MKKIIYCLLVFSHFELLAQPFCFYNPNTGPHYHNGSSGSIYDITSGDFNSDDHIDFVTANSVGSNISFIPGYGDGTLGSPDTIGVPGVIFCVQAADFNNDQLLDLAVGGSSALYVLLGNGDGTFTQVSQHLVPYSSRIHVQDMNHDQKIDIVIAAQAGIFVLISQGGGMFQVPDYYSPGGEVVDVAIADFNGDTIPDLVSTTHVSLSTSVLSFLEGKGNGSFEMPVSLPVPHYSIFGIAPEDLDNDGKMDLVVSNSNISVNRIELYYGKGDGTFKDPKFFDTGIDPLYVYMHDIDNDEIKDVVMPSNGGFTILKRTDPDTLFGYQSYSSIAAPTAVAVEDINEDGKLDVVVPSSAFGSGLIGVNLNCDTATGIAETIPQAAVTVQVFPNPAINKVGLLANKKCTGLTIYDKSGRKVFSDFDLLSNRYDLDISGFTPGIYFINIILENHLSTTCRFLKTE